MSTYEMLVQYIVANQERFYRLAFSYTRNREAALDVVQNAVCSALEKHGSIRNADYIKTWFYKVLVNESLMYLRKNRNEVAAGDDAILESQVYIETVYEASDETAEAIGRLPEEQKTIITLHYYEGLTLKEIAAITDVNLSTVKTRLYSAQKKLKEYLSD